MAIKNNINPYLEWLTQLKGTVTDAFRYYCQPLPSGSYSLDEATRGGLPRGEIIALTGNNLIPTEAQVYTAIATIQDMGGTVAVIDYDRSFSEKLSQKFNIDPDKVVIVQQKTMEQGLVPGETQSNGLLAVVQPESIEQGLAIVEEVVRNNLVDLVVSYDSFKSEEILSYIKKLLKVVEQSNVCVVFSGASLPAMDQSLRQLPIMNVRLSNSEKYKMANPATIEVFEKWGVWPRVGQTHITQDGVISKLGELWELGITKNLVERHGSYYRCSGVLLGHGRRKAWEALRQHPDLISNLKSEIERDISRQREEKFGDWVQRKRDAEPEPQLPPESTESETEEPEKQVPKLRYVNTWFEGEEPVLPLLVGRSYDFFLDISSKAKEDELDSASSTKLKELDFGELQEIDLLISFYSEDFEIKDKSLPLTLKKNEDSDFIKTQVLPLHSGRTTLRIVIRLLRQLDVLQRLKITLEVQDKKSESQVTLQEARSRKLTSTNDI